MMRSLTECSNRDFSLHEEMRYGESNDHITMNQNRVVYVWLYDDIMMNDDEIK